MAQKPARISGWMQDSVPPASTASASPRRISSARLADRVRAGRAGGDGRVVRAAEAERDRDLAARRVDEHARDEERGDAVGAALAQDASGRRSPAGRRSRSRRRSPTRAGSTPLSPASRHASCAAPSARSTFRSIRRASFGGATDVGSKPFTSAAIRTGNSLGSKAWMKSTPLSPGDRGAPRRRRVEADRRDRSEAGDGDASHRASQM